MWSIADTRDWKEFLPETLLLLYGRLQTAAAACKSCLHRLDWSANITDGGLVGVVPLHKSCDIKLWLFQHLNLSDVAILHGEDAVGLAGNLLANGCGDKLLDQGLEVALGSQFRHSCNHLCSDSANLGGFGVTCVLDLSVLRSSEGDAKHTNNVSIRCTTVHIGLNNGLLLSDQTAKLITSHVHSVEVEEAIEALNVLDTKLDFAEGVRFILIQISQRKFHDASLQALRRNLCSLRLGDEGLADILGGEDGGSNKVVPFLLEERINSLLAASLLTLCQPLVLSLLIGKSTS